MFNLLAISLVTFSAVLAMTCGPVSELIKENERRDQLSQKSELTITRIHSRHSVVLEWVHGRASLPEVVRRLEGLAQTHNDGVADFEIRSSGIDAFADYAICVARQYCGGNSDWSPEVLPRL